MARRDVILEAAVHLVADGGVRRLTHRAVDAHAGLPAGSTSNLFRNRAALIDAILLHLIERERAALDALQLADAMSAPTAEVVVQLGAGMIRDALGTGRGYVLARRALFLDAAHDPEVVRRLEAASRYWWDLVAGLLLALEVPDSQRRGRWLLAYLDGIIGDQLARPEGAFDPVAAFAPAVHGILHLAQACPSAPESGAGGHDGRQHRVDGELDQALVDARVPKERSE